MDVQQQLVQELLSAQQALEVAVEALDQASRRSEDYPRGELVNRALLLGRFMQNAVTNKHERQRLDAPQKLVEEMLSAQRNLEGAVEALHQASRGTEHDPLTQLPNRTLFLGRFIQAVTHAERNDKRIALLFLDLDDFKAINDIHGHQVGDRILKSVADCLAATVRETDTVSRYGGDEFLILLTDIGNVSDAARIADKILAALNQAVRFDDRLQRMSASFGISVYPEDGVDLDALIHCADMAMYEMKRRMRGRFNCRGDAASAASTTFDSKLSIGDPESTRDVGAPNGTIDGRTMREIQPSSVMSRVVDLQTAVDRARRIQTAFVDLLAQLLGESQILLRESAMISPRSAARSPDLARLQTALEQRLALAHVLTRGVAGSARVPLQSRV